MPTLQIPQALGTKRRRWHNRVAFKQWLQTAGLDQQPELWSELLLTVCKDAFDAGFRSGYQRGYFKGFGSGHKAVKKVS